MAGSNELNMLLKAQVVKVKAELDVKGSMPKIKLQVDEISKKLENKPVKLKIKLDFTITEVNRQLSDLSKKIHGSKTFKNPLKFKVDIDVAGSASEIKKRLQDIYKTVQDFNKKYAEQIKKMQQQQAKFNQQQGGSKQQNPNIPPNASVSPFNMKLYTQQVNQARDMMKSMFGKGNFKSFEMKDANGNLQGFIAQLEKANGVVQKIKYQWDAQAGKFTPINQQTINSMENHIHKASQQLRGLYAEIEKLGKSKGKSNLFQEYDNLEKRIGHGTLTQDAVKNLQQRIKEEGVLQQQLKQENDFLFQQKKLIADIKKASMGIKDVSKRKDFGQYIQQARKADDSNALREIRLETDKLTQSLKRKEQADMESQRLLKEKLKLSRELKQLERQVTTSGRNPDTSKRFVTETRAMIQQIKSTKDLEQARRRLDSIKSGKWENDMSRRIATEVSKVEDKLRRLREIGGVTQASFSRQMNLLAENSKKGLGEVQRQFDDVARKVKQKEREMREEANKVITLLNGKGTSATLQSKTQLSNIKSAINTGDIAQLQKYIGQIYKGKVETIRMTDTTDSLGRAVQRMQVKMSGTGKTVKTYTVDLDRANNAMRQVSSGIDYNANRNLGVFEQLKIAMARVPVWMTSMTAFYGTIRTVKAMSNEIFEVDKALTTLRRVTNSKVNVDVMFEGAVGLSRELGNNIHDITEALIGFARKFGDFNERQLLALTKTATLMSNVSGLTTEEAMSTLIATMNAFNIEASQTIKIVDALNEVDNNYAVSTQQLSEGLAKSANAAKSFGVTMHENVGHITAISSVTQESGNIIGNSLKTIYSRITTMNEVEGILNSVGVAVYNIGENGKEVRPVNDILGDLAGKWHDLSDSERQHIGVQVAGRHQLSRFLGLMNNYQIAINATSTALASEGSATRENEKYMQSFEARLNKLKNSFTELSLAVGDKVLSGSILAIIEGFGKLIEFATKVSDSIGVLPVVFFGIGTILALMGTFKGSIGSTITMLKLMKAEFVNASAGMGVFRGGLAGTMGSLRSLQVLLPTLRAGLRALRVAFMGLVSSTVIGLAFVAVGIAIEKLIGYFQKQKKIAEDTAKANRKLVDSYRNTAGGLDVLIKKHNELKDKVDNGTIKEGTEAYNEYLKVNQELSRAMPSVVKYVDAKGVAHMKTAEAIEKEYELARKLSEENAKLRLEEHNEKIENRARKIKNLAKEIGNLVKQQKKLEKEDGKEQKRYLGEGQYYTEKADNGKDIQRTKIEAINAYQAIYKEIQKMNIEVRGTVMASLEASGHLKHLSDTQRKTVESVIQNNEHFMTDIAEKMAKTSDPAKLEKLNQQLIDRADQLFKIGEDIGQMIANKSDELVKSATKGLTNPVEIEKATTEIQTRFDNLLKSLPKTFFNLESLKSADDFKGKLEGVLNVADKIKAGNGNTNGLIKELKRYNIEGEEAKRIVMQLGFQYDNQALKAEALKQAEAGMIDNLGEYVEVALEAIDVTKNLFGYGSNETSALSSHIETLQWMKLLYKDNAKESDVWKSSIETVSVALGVSEKKVEKNLGHYHSMLELLPKLKLKYDEKGNAIGIETKELTKNEIAVWRKIKANGEEGMVTDILTGKTEKLNGEIEENTKKENKNAKSKKDSKKATDEQKEAIYELSEKFKTLKKDMSETNKSSYINTIQEQLSELNGKVNITKDETGKLKFVMADGSESNYLKALQKQLEDLGIRVGLVKDESGNLKITLNDGTGSTTLTTIDENAKDAKVAIDNTITSVDILNEKKILPNDYSQIDFAELSKGVEDTTQKVQLLSEALQGTAENTSALNAIQGALEALQKLAGDIKTYIGSTLDGAKGDLGELAKNAEDAKTKIDGLKTALENIKSDSKKISLTGLNNLQSDIDNVLDSIGRLRGIFGEISQYARDGADGVKSASGKIKESVNEAEKAVDKLGDSAKNNNKDIKSSFDDASKAVSSKTDTMINKHNSQRTAIDKLADSARVAKNAITDMVRFANSAMKDLDNYIVKANKAKSASSDTPRTFSDGVFGGFSLGGNGGSDLGSRIDSAISTFSASSDGVMGTSSGGDTGTSGIIQPSYDSDGGVEWFSAFASKTAKAPKTPKAPRPEKKEEAYKVNKIERSLIGYESLLQVLEIKMQNIVKNSLKYRDSLKKAMQYQNTILSLSKKELNATEKRNKDIEKRLKNLPAVKDQNVKQRAEYNKLQQEYDANLSKIASLKGNIQTITNDIKNKSLEIFTDFIEQIANKYDKAIKKIQDKTENIQFKLDVLELTNPDDVEEQLKLLAKKARSIGKEEATAENKKNSMESQLNKAVKKYGKNSDQAKKAQEEYDKANKEWEEAYIKLLQAEKDIKDVRATVADNGIKQLKDYYGKMKDMAMEAIEREKKELEKAHTAKMKMYDDEVDKINKVYDAKFKQMDKEKSESNYQQELDEKNAKKAELMNKIALLSKDTSLEGKKKLAELQKELAEASKDIEKFMKDRQDELLRESLEDQKQAQIDAINAQKEAEQGAYEDKVEALDKEKEDIAKHYDDILNNEKYWAEMRNEFINGSFKTLNKELEDMNKQIEKMTKGNFDNLTSGFASFSDDIKKELAGLWEIDVSNLKFNGKTAVEDAKDAGKTKYDPYKGKGTEATKTKETTSKDKKTDSKSGSKDSKSKDDPKKSDTTKKDNNREVTTSLNFRKSPAYGNNVIEVLSKGTKVEYVSMENGWAKIKYKGKTGYVGNQYLKKFDTGGYTGDWAGDEGKIAMLHKKELVLDKNQTKDILDTVKIMDKLKNIIPNISKANALDKIATASSVVTNITYGDIHITVQGGDKKKATDIAKELMNGIKKRGK